MKSLAALLIALSPPTLRPGQIVDEIDPRIWVIHADRAGTLWFGSNGNGVYKYDGETAINYTTAHGLSGLQVRDIQEDAEGNVLVATVEGVAKFDGESFTRLEIVDPSPGEDGWDLNPDDVWIRFDAGEYGTLRFDGEKLYHLKLPKSPVEDRVAARYANAPGFFSPFSVYSVYEDRRGHVWFGTAGVGLCRYDGRVLSWMYEEDLTTTPSGGAFGIRSIYEDRAGDFWICTTRHRFEISPEVIRKDGYDLIEYGRKEGLPDAGSDSDENFDFYPSMTEDATGSLWMACGSSVVRYDGERVSRFAIAEGAYAAAIHCGRTGTVWVGTVDHGIYTFNGEGFERFEID